MRFKVERIARGLADSLSALAELECLAVGQAAEEDILDPYFSLIIDAYFRGGVPSVEGRKALYGAIEHFETGTKRAKDRFFMEDVPVHVNLIDAADFDAFLDGRGALEALVRESGTHCLYRLCECRVLFSRSDWHSRVKAALAGLGEGFWAGLRDAYYEKMDHFLSDMGASTLRGDGYFTLVSTAEFLKYAASAIFALNRKFEPAHRFVSREVRKLPALPASFLSRWDSLLREHGELTPPRKYEIAKLLAKSLFGMN
jgi:hypothetical protein